MIDEKYSGNGFFHNIIDHFNWANGTALYLFFVVPAVVFLLQHASRRFNCRLTTVQPGRSEDVRLKMSVGASFAKNVMLLGVFIFLLIAVAGPRWGWQWKEGLEQGADVIVAVDVSKSMLVEDLSPSRLERSRRMIIDLLDAYPGDRFGLVFFAGSAFLQCPLTRDHDAIRSFLDHLDVESIPVGGTNISDAVTESLRALKAGGENNAAKGGGTIVMLSDGEDQEGAFDGAIKTASKNKVSIVAVGMGTLNGGPIPDGRGGFFKDSSGEVVISKLNDSTLRLITRETGGVYVGASDSAGDVVKALQKSQSHSNTSDSKRYYRQKVWFERYQWPASLALVLLLIELFVVDVRRLAFGLLIMFGMSTSFVDVAFAESDREKYNDVIKQLNSDDSAYLESSFQELAHSKDPEVSRRALYNLGNIYSSQSRFEEAVKHYELALKKNPQDQQVRDNLKWAKDNSSPKQDQQKQDQQKQDQQKQDQQKQDQQKQDQQKQDQQKQDQQKQDQQKQDQQKQDQQKQDQQKQDQQKQDQQKQDVDQEEVEKLLRSVPDERKSTRPLYQSGKGAPRKVDRDW